MSHRIRKVASEHDPVCADAIHEEAQGLDGVHDRVVVEAAQRGRRRRGQTSRGSSWKHLEAAVLPPDLIRQGPSAVCETHLEVRVPLEDFAENQMRRRDRLLGGVADDVVESSASGGPTQSTRTGVRAPGVELLGDRPEDLQPHTRGSCDPHRCQESQKYGRRALGPVM
jgi:hypothetical protein